MATSPLELTATPDTSPTFMSAGIFRKFTLPSNGISGTCAYTGAAPINTTNARAMRFIRILPCVTTLNAELAEPAEQHDSPGSVVPGLVVRSLSRGRRFGLLRMQHQLLYAPVQELGDVDLV